MLQVFIAVFFLFILLILAIFTIIFYNRFQVLKNGAEAGLSQIMVALKKRLDLVSQLIEIVKGYTKFERSVLERITELRSHVNEYKNSEYVRNIDTESKSILDKIMIVVESYPDLKASNNFSNLMKTITEVEDEIARQRYTYNNIVQEYNTRCYTFPSNIIARVFSFKKTQYLQFEDEINKRPDGTWDQ